LARNLQEQQCKLRAKPFGHGFAGQANVRCINWNIDSLTVIDTDEAFGSLTIGYEVSNEE